MRLSVSLVRRSIILGFRRISSHITVLSKDLVDILLSQTIGISIETLEIVDWRRGPLHYLKVFFPGFTASLLFL